MVVDVLAAVVHSRGASSRYKGIRPGSGPQTTQAGRYLREADALACGVLWAIIRVAAGEKFDTRDAWVERIDSLAHLFGGDPDVVTDERLAAVGAVPSFRAGPPPPMLRDRTAR